MGNALQIQETASQQELQPQETFTAICRTNKLKPRQRKALRCLQRTLVVTDACREAGICERTFYNWLDRPAFRKAYDAAMQATVPAVEIAHFQAAKGKDTLARIHILKNRHPMYREKPLEIVQRTDANTVLTAAANAIAATELSKAIGLLIGPTKAQNTEVEIVELERDTIPSLPETLSIPTP